MIAPIPVTYTSPHPYAGENDANAESYAYYADDGGEGGDYGDDGGDDGTIIPTAISFPMAIELEISFGSATETELNTDFVILCTNVFCAGNIWGNYSGTTFPGKDGNPSLIVAASAVYLRFVVGGANTNSLWGYSMTVTPLYGTW